MKAIYRILSLLNDLRAVAKGRIWQRLANRMIGRHVVRRLWR